MVRLLTFQNPGVAVNFQNTGERNVDPGEFRIV